MSGHPVAIGELLASKYRVERVLGQGGMGVVVSAMHEQLEQRVALKFLLESGAAVGLHASTVHDIVQGRTWRPA